MKKRINATPAPIITYHEVPPHLMAEYEGYGSEDSLYFILFDEDEDEEEPWLLCLCDFAKITTETTPSFACIVSPNDPLAQYHAHSFDGYFFLQLCNEDGEMGEEEDHVLFYS